MTTPTKDLEYAITKPVEDDDDELESMTGTAQREDTSSTEEIAIGVAENKRVSRNRFLVAVVLLVCATAAAVLTYVITDREERQSFENEFAGIASEIISVSQRAEENIFKVMDDFSTMMTSSALATNQTWPFYITPDFERRARASRAVSGGRMLVTVNAVPPAARDEWNDFANRTKGWMQESAELRNVTPAPFLPVMSTFNYTEEGPQRIIPVTGGDDLHLVASQVSPVPTAHRIIVNIDFGTTFIDRWRYMEETGRSARSQIVNMNFWLEEPADGPVNLFYQPVFDSFDEENRNLAAFVYMALRVQDHFEDLLHDGAVGIYVVLTNTCNKTVTYQVNGRESEYLGEGDLHEEEYDYLGIEAGLTVALNEILEGGTESQTGMSCGYYMTIYPSALFHENFQTSRPVVYTIVVLAIFACTSLIFILYDCSVQRRQETVMDSAVKSNKIVNDLFPEQFREQMLENANNSKQNDASMFKVNGTRKSLTKFMSGDLGPFDDDEDIFMTKPVADLFAEATVLFADIVGFTAWSSVREPSQVFTLLESIYRAFDKVAARRHIFKVETVADSYVAVAGVPKPVPNHAMVMARFARDCLHKLPQVVSRLDKHLGPGTRDLTMRFGIHSGPVTAGVLRGEKARFQLFGDTVNTAARIESTSIGNKIHLSDRTAQLICAAGKGAWVERRSEKVHLKGKGTMETYWLNAQVRAGLMRAGSVCGSMVSDQNDRVEQATYHSPALSDHTRRLVEWNIESLSRLLRQIVAYRKTTSTTTKTLKKVVEEGGPSTLDEVAEVIALPGFDQQTACKKVDPDTIVLGPDVMKQLYSYVSWVAQSYNDNPFHNFEHASHVMMSIMKLLSRIVAPELEMAPDTDEKDRISRIAAQLHDNTYGITSDPMTQFAIALSALVHDCDHRGVPNGRLVEEDEHLARLYDQSVAEQHSIDTAWSELMSDDYKDLRACIYSSDDELKRFRQVVVNVVLATDIFDKQLKKLRNARWEKAFRVRSPSETLGTVDVNRKATIVMEHIMQASDVAHCMQHWHVYTKWNERLFQEMFKAYATGRADKDPSLGWYKGELWFFDNYIIPLSKKLHDCGVFGVSSDEYLNYATENRKEWAEKGEAIVAEMANKYRTLLQPTEVPEAFSDEEEGTSKIKNELEV
ncbi:Receptor-type guanylate cyclase gcy [Seminavis robusta]|uniref:Receptor-type guanylate cyclase gcy n=1 Tax=Seminavis robusta TaxID=568900 RepID=A0A9N8HY34_9STRA|nr:Receptor-type guanylate cyclase gcy [Seminavis robusta]|eukprot:Sro2685_g334570.1 Receptor-type guanylate cyclase gcy (1148) ;mRNA; r:5705-10404